VKVEFELPAVVVIVVGARTTVKSFAGGGEVELGIDPPLQLTKLNNHRQIESSGAVLMTPYCLEKHSGNRIESF
jgi:hypothetical protein